MPTRSKQIILDPDIAKALLSVPMPGEEEKTCWDVLFEAASRLADVVVTCREVLEDSPQAVKAAQSACEEKDGQTGNIRITDSGSVVVNVEMQSDRRSWNSELPSISTIRKKASSLGIDPKPYGRRKRDLLKAISEAESTNISPAQERGEAPVQETKPTVEETSEALEDIQEPAREEAEPTQEEATQEPEIPESVQSLLDSRKNRPARPRPKKSLGQLAKAAAAIDMDELLGLD